jgi:hypothetical protein
MGGSSWASVSIPLAEDTTICRKGQTLALADEWTNAGPGEKLIQICYRFTVTWRPPK